MQNIINFKIIKVDNKHILHLKTDPSDDDVFVDDNVYYMRTNPATIKLEGKQMIDYINQRKAKRKEADK